MDFGDAIKAIRNGQRVCRSGWNGKGMWIAMTAASVIPATQARSVATIAIAAERAPYLDQAGDISIGAHIDMRAADGTLVIGWLASQTDLLADDWQILPD